MSFRTETAYASVCDMCGAVFPQDSPYVTDSPLVTLVHRFAAASEVYVDICPACLSRPVSDVFVALEKRRAEQAEAARNTTRGMF